MNLRDHLIVLYISLLEFIWKRGKQLFVLVVNGSVMIAALYFSYRTTKYILRLAQSPRFVCLKIDWVNNEPRFENIMWYRQNDAYEYVVDNVCHPPFADWQYVILTAFTIMLICLFVLAIRTYPTLKARKEVLVQSKASE